MNNANNVFNFTETNSINSMYQTGNNKASTKRRSGIRVAFIHLGFFAFLCKQGKSEGFDSCDRPSKLTQIRFKLPIFQPVWPWNLTDDLKKFKVHLFYITSSFVHHLKPIGEFKLELLSGNTQFRSKSMIFCPVWPWNLMDDLEKQ